MLLFSCSSNENINLTEIQQEGQQLYSRYCVQCHGYSGDKGFGGAAKLTLSKLDKDVEFEVIAKGRGKMPAQRAHISDNEIRAIIEYLDILKQ